LWSILSGVQRPGAGSLPCRGYDQRVAGRLRIGTCSWADEALLKVWYPRGLRTGEERLRYYADHFDTVEVDSTFYRLPSESIVSRWAQATPDGFVFHVKAFAVMTRHPARVEQLPPELRDQVAVDERGRVNRPSEELRTTVFDQFHEALRPLRETGKLGGILLQFPPYVVAKASSEQYLAWAVEQLHGDRPLVEFRHRSWLTEERRERTLGLLERLGATFVVTDSPELETNTVVPTVVATTADVAYVRFHGRNRDTWHRRGGSAAERFDYLYTEDELRGWLPALTELTERAEEVYAFFNNNARSRRGEREVAQAAENAQMLLSIAQGAGLLSGP
jgi:uncharacterized protein YecE (DUF72 family)